MTMTDTAPTATPVRHPEPIVRAIGLRKTYGDVEVLRGVDLAVMPGTVLALLGPNGAGKTTTVRILSTLLAPGGGTATIAGHDVVRQPNAVKQIISVTGQYAAVDGMLTGRENLVLMGRLLHLGRAGARTRAEELLERFELVDAADRAVRTWSGGMKRRLDLAVGLIARPAVIFLDEPTTGLDPHARQTTWRAITELVAAGTTIVLTTQYLEEADQLADRIAVLSEGTIIAEGTAAELKARIPGERVELTFADDAAYRRALAAAGAAAGPPDHLDPERHRFSVPTDGTPTALKHVLDALDRDDVTVTDLQLHRPTLDDVFLLLTGAPTAAADGSDRRTAIRTTAIRTTADRTEGTLR